MSGQPVKGSGGKSQNLRKNQALSWALPTHRTPSSLSNRVSVPTNIVEGSKRQTNADYARFVNIAEASLAETEYLLLLAWDLGYFSNDVHQPIAAEIDEVARRLHALRVKVEQGDP